MQESAMHFVSSLRLEIWSRPWLTARRNIGCKSRPTARRSQARYCIHRCREVQNGRGYIMCEWVTNPTRQDAALWSITDPRHNSDNITGTLVSPKSVLAISGPL